MHAPKESLDQPETKQLSGLDLVINRYRFINPDKDELMIIELPSKGYLWITGVVLFGAMALLFSYLTYHYFMEPGGIGASVLTLFLALLSYTWIGVIIFGKFYSKRTWHFTASELIETSTFGRKRILDKKKVISIYIEVAASKNSTNWFVSLKRRGDQNDFLAWYLTHISPEDVKKYGHESAEAGQITNLIADFWNIPIHK